MPSGVSRPVRGPRVRTNPNSAAIRATPDRDSRAVGVSATVGTRPDRPKTACKNR